MDDYEWIETEEAPSSAALWTVIAVPFAAFWLAVGYIIGRNV